MNGNLLCFYRGVAALNYGTSSLPPGRPHAGARIHHHRQVAGVLVGLRLQPRLRLVDEQRNLLIISQLKKRL